MLKLRATPYIRTYGSEAYKRFLSQPFDIKLLANSSETIFHGWHAVDRGNYHLYMNLGNPRWRIEYYAVGYNVISPAGNKHFPVHPLNIDQFITDCERGEIELYWRESILNTFEVHEILTPAQVEEYHNLVLDKLGKLD